MDPARYTPPGAPVSTQPGQGDASQDRDDEFENDAENAGACQNRLCLDDGPSASPLLEPSAQITVDDVRVDAKELREALDQTERTLLLDAQQQEYSREQADRDLQWEHNQIFDFASKLQGFVAADADEYQARCEHLQAVLDAERKKRKMLEAQLHELEASTHKASRGRSELKASGSRRWNFFPRKKQHSTLEDIDEEGTRDGNFSDDGSVAADVTQKAPAPAMRRIESIPTEWDAEKWRRFLGAVKVTAVVFALFLLAWTLALALVLRPERQWTFAKAPELVTNTVQARQFSISAAMTTTGSLHYVAIPTSAYQKLEGPVRGFDVAGVQTDVQKQSEVAQVAAACGEVHASSQARELTVFTIHSTSGSLPECETQHDAPKKFSTPSCERCPMLTPDTEYTVLVVGDIGPPQRMGPLTAVATLAVRTAHEGQPRFAEATRVAREGVDFVDLTVQLSAPGSVYYAIAHRFVQAQFFQSYLLSSEQTNMPPQRVVRAATEAAAGLQRGAIVAAGSIEVLDARRTFSSRVRPICSSDACDVPENSAGVLLSPATDYFVTLVAISHGGGSDVTAESTLQLSFRTLDDTEPPQPFGSFSAVSESSFDFELSQNEAGTAHFALVVPEQQERFASLVRPGSSMSQTSTGVPSGTSDPSRGLRSAIDGPRANSTMTKAAAPGRRQDLGSGGIAWAPCACCAPQLGVCDETARQVLEGPVSRLAVRTVLDFGCLSLERPEDRAQLRFPLARPSRRLLQAENESLFAGAPVNQTQGWRLQTYSLAPGTIAIYVVVTRDDWSGSAGPNRMAQPEYFVVRTADSSPPTFAAGFPAVDRLYFTAARLAFATSEPAIVSYIVLERSFGITPTADEVFDLTVQPRINAEVASSGTLNVTEAAAAVISNATGLTGLTAYTAWAVAVDYFGNRMLRPVKLPFETLDNQPPVLQSRIVNVGVNTATLIVQLDEPGSIWFQGIAVTGSDRVCPEPEVLLSQRTDGAAQSGVIDVVHSGVEVARDLTSLKGQTRYLVCMVATDSFLNTPLKATLQQFTTLDGTAPVLTLQATPERPPTSAADSLCRVSVQLSLSEPGSGAVIVVPADAMLGPVQPDDLLTNADTRDAGLQASILDEATIAATDDLSPAVRPLRVPCDTQLQVMAAMADVQGNLVDGLQSVAITTPDVLPPRFVLDTPRVMFQSSTSATFGVAIDEAGSIAFEVLQGSAICASAAQLLDSDATNLTIQTAGEVVTRQETGLQPVKAYVACFVAIDTDGNMQAEATRIPFSTADTIPPRLTIRVRAETLMHGVSNVSCSLLAEAKLSEAGHARLFALSPSSSLSPDDFVPSDLYTSGLRDAAGASLLADRLLTVGSQEVDAFVGVSIGNLPCASTVQIWAAARDSTGNLNEYIQVLEVDTLDVLGPQFVLGTPTIEVAASASRGPQNDNVTVALDEPGSVTCIVEPCDALLTDAQCAAAVQPSALQVLAGEVVGAVSSGTVQLDAAEAIAEIELLWNQEIKSSHRVCCAGIDAVDNAMNAAVCRLRAGTHNLELRNATVACLAPGVVDISFAASYSGTTAFAVLRADALKLPDFDADPSLLFGSTAALGAVARGQMAYTTPGLLNTLGACDVPSPGDFAAFIAMRSADDEARYSKVVRLNFRLPDLCSGEQELLCEPDELLGILRPRMRVIVGTSLLVGPGQLFASQQGLIYRQFVNSTQKLGFFDNAPPGAVTKLQALAGDRPARPLQSAGPNPAEVPLTLSTAAQPVHRVRLVACSHALHVEHALVSGERAAGRQLFCTYALQDTAGRSAVSTDGLRLRLMFLRASGVRMLVDPAQDCRPDAIDAVTGVGTCNVTVPLRHFPSDADSANGQVTLEAQVRGVVVAVSEGVTVLMHGPASWVTPALHTVYGFAPRRPLFEGEDFAISLFVNSGRESVDGFQFRILYDPAVISFQRLQPSSSFTPSSADMVVADDSNGSVNFLVQGQGSGAPSTAFAGDRVGLADVFFRVASVAGDSQGTSTILQVGSDVDPVYISSLTSNGDDITKGQTRAQMKDHRAGLHPFAQVRLMPFSIVGLVASAPYVDLLSLQSITGIADTVSIPMTPTWNSPAEKPNAVDLAAASPLACVCAPLEAGRAFAQAGKCIFETAAQLPAGLHRVMVTGRLGNHSDSALLRLAQLHSVAVHTRQHNIPVIKRVLPETVSPADCATHRYQTLDVIALATARAGDAEIAEIDVTHLVEFFASSQRVTVSREGTVRVEAGSGTTDFRVGVAPRLSGSDLQVQPLQATVSEDEVRVIALHPVAVAGHQIQPAEGYEGAIPIDHSFTQVQVTVRPTFGDEASRGQVFVVAQYSDGSYRDVTEHATLESLDQDIISVSQGAAGINVTAGEFGTPSTCANLLRAHYAPCNVDITPASRTGPVHVDLPTLTGIASLDASVPEITCEADPAALQPISIPLAASLNAALAFSDGKQRTILDERAVFAVAPGSSAVCSVDHDTQKGTALVIATGPSCAAADCVVTLTYPSLNASLSADVSVPIVVAEEVQAFLQPLDAPPNCIDSVAQQSAPSATLHPISCSSADYQQLTVCALAQLSISSVSLAVRSFDVTQHCSFQLSSAAEWVLRPNLHDISVSNRIRPLVPGSSTLLAKFGALDSDPVAMTASAAAVAVSALTVAWSPLQLGVACGQLCSETFTAQRGTQHPLDVTLTLTDGYVYSALAMRLAINATMDVIDVPQVLAFTSAAPDAILLGSRGSAQLLANAAGAVQLESSTTCSVDNSRLIGNVDVYSNLQPSALDIDIGSAFGPALQGSDLGAVGPFAVQAGQFIEAPVAINTSAAPLRAADVEVAFDDSVLRAVGCRAGASIASQAGFECRYNIFGHLDSVQISYVDESTSQPVLDGAGLAELAVLQLQVLRAATSSVSATIQTAQTGDGSVRNNIPSVAANVPFVATPSTRRRLNEAVEHRPPATVLARSPVASRELLDTTSGMFFDVNGDGAFSAADYVMLGRLGVLWTNDYADGALPWLQAFEELNVGSAISDWQLQSTDPDFIYFSGRPAPGLPALARADNSVRPNFEERLLSGSAVQQQYYQQYVRPATQRSFKQMQRAAIKKQLFLRDFDVKQPEDVSSFARISVTLATDLAVPLLASNRSVQVELEFNSTAALAFLGNSVRTESATYLTRAEYDGSAGTFYVEVKEDATACAASADVNALQHVEVAVITVMLDADGAALNETFYPYYGSSEKQRYLPSAQRTFQSEFQPYALVDIEALQPLGFAPGYPSAVDIRATSFTVQLLLTQRADSVSVAVFDAAALTDSLPSLDSPQTFAEVFATLNSTYAEVVVGSATATEGVAAFAVRNDASAAAPQQRFAIDVATGTQGQGGVRTAVIAVTSGCHTAYATLEDIVQPDRAAPTFTSLSVDSPCINLDAASGTAAYRVVAELDESADVWLVAYRNFSALSSAPPVDPQATTGGAPYLDIPACRSAAMAATIDAFRPCQAIAYQQQRTSPIGLDTGEQSRRHAVTFDVAADIRPGLGAVESLDASCQYKHLFGFSSSIADLHLVARDVGPTRKQFEDACSLESVREDFPGVWRKLCRQGDLGTASPQNIQSASTTTLIHQRDLDSQCAAQVSDALAAAEAGDRLLVHNKDDFAATFGAGRFAGSALTLQVAIGLPPPPAFVQTPVWDASRSDADTIALTGSISASGIVYYAAYEFTFNPRDGLQALSSGLRPVSAGSVAVLPTSGNTSEPIFFDLQIGGCHNLNDPEFSSWPILQPSTGYFVIVAVASQHGALNPSFIGAVASTGA